MTILEANLSVLKEREPSLIARIFEGVTLDEELEVFSTPSGYSSAAYHGNTLHSRRDPVKEAKRFVDTWRESVPQILIMEGFGLGYQARAFLDAYPDLTIWIIEPDIRMHYTILSKIDLGDLLQNPRLLFFYAPPAESLGLLAGETGHSNFAIVKIRSVYQKNCEYFQNIDKEIKAVISRRNVNKNTLRRFGPLWIRNLIKNTPLLPEIKGIHHLENIFSDYPALIIAAGPSLEGFLPHLSELSKKFILVCVDTACPLVAREGIQPDFVTMVDPQYWNTRHLDGQDLNGSILISESSVYPALLRDIRDGIFFFESYFPLNQYFEEGTDIRGSLSPGGSVATTAWEICRHMGVREIYCTGLDLGFPGGQTHHRESFFEYRALSTANRFCPLETSAFHALYDAFPVIVPDNSGGGLLSDKRMDVYIKWFENQMNRHPSIKTFTLSSRGTAIKGMELTGIDSLKNKKDIRSIIEEKKKTLFLHTTAQETKTAAGLKAKIVSLISEFGQTEQFGCRGLELTANLKETISKKKPVESILFELDELDREIMNSSVKQMAGFLFQDLIERISESKNTDPLESSIHLYTEIIAASRFHRKLLINSLEKLDPQADSQILG